MRDLRDPQALGETILGIKRSRRFSTLSRTYDRCVDAVRAVPMFHDPTTSIQRYGDPRAAHENRIALGTEPTL